MNIDWYSTSKLESRDFRCGYCGKIIASDNGYFPSKGLDGKKVKIYICPHCAKPTFFHGEEQHPGIVPGNDVNSVPDEVHALYNEARNCVAASAYTASVLICRKLLMNLAVSQGANENLRFIEYVDYLAKNGFVPPNGKGWVDHIRKKGNEATHEIVVMKQEDAHELILFSEMLLKFIFEFPAKIPTKSNT